MNLQNIKLHRVIQTPMCDEVEELLEALYFIPKISLIDIT